MRIVFMGTPDFAVPSLEKLARGPDDVCAVYTQPDRPKGRGHHLQSPPVKEFALTENIPVFQPDSLKKDEVLDELKALSPDLIVVVAYGKILPPQVLSLPRFGCINVHGSLLPKYRGAAPIQWTVLNGDRTAGVTTMFMNAGLDTGDILLKAETEVGEDETSGDLYERLSVLGADLLEKTIGCLRDGSLNPVGQDDGAASYAPMLSREMSELDLLKPAREIHRLICGLSDWPCAHITFEGKRLKIYRSHLCPLSGKPGEILDDRKLVVACGDGSVEFSEVQYEGSKKMSGSEFMRGRRLKKGDLIWR